MLFRSTIPFALNWSSHSRNFSEETPLWNGPENEALIEFAKEYRTTHPDIDYFIFGHRHVLVDYNIADDCHVVILGDWIHHFSYARYDGNCVKLGRFVS